MNGYRLRSPFRSLRWFFLLWLGTLFLWGILELMARGQRTGNTPQNCAILPLGPDGCLQLPPQGATGNLQAIMFFTLLMCCLGILLWVSASRNREPRFYWYSLPLQLMLLLLLLLIRPPLELEIMLLLVLLLEFVTLLEHIRLIVLAVSGSCVLFFFLLLGSLHQWRYIMPVHLSDLSSMITMFLLLGGYLVLYVQLTASYTHLQNVHYELAEAHTRLQASMEHIEELTRVMERQRLARELHDTLAQGLSGVMMQLQAANSRLTHQRYELAQEAIQQAISDIREALHTARQAIDNLRAEDSSYHDLPHLLATTTQRFAAATGIPCTNDIQFCESMPGHLTEQVIRTLSEGLTNVARHAQASQIWIRFFQEEGIVILEVRDDGIGFDPMTVSRGHYGLLGLRERALRLDGNLEVVSTPNEGTVLRLRFPLPVIKTPAQVLPKERTIHE